MGTRVCLCATTVRKIKLHFDSSPTRPHLFLNSLCRMANLFHNLRENSAEEKGK